MFTTVWRLIKAGVTNFFRNGWLSLASTTIMTLTLLTISIFLILNIVLTQGIQTIQDKIDISVYINDTAKEGDIIKLQEKLSNTQEIKNIKYVSKAEALERYKETFASNPQLKDSLQDGENPLPASLEIKTYTPDQLPLILPILERPEYKSVVKKISYKENKEVIDRLFKATEFIKKVGWGLALVFIFTSLIVIFNTIRIAIFTHKEEIEIMKLVGANPWFIKWPFLIEGMLYGVIGTIFSLGAIYIILRMVSTSLNNYFGGGDTGNQVIGFLVDNLAPLIVLQLGAGIFIGVSSSYMAVRKHLKKA